MHEYSIIQALVARVEQEVHAYPGAQVRRLWVRIGELSGVEIDLLATAYETFRAKTVVADAELEIRRVPASWACSSCAQPLERGALLRCPRCGKPAKLKEGDEINLDRIEMEVPDV